MKRLFILTGFAAIALACGGNDQKTPKTEPGFNLSKSDAAEKNWANGDINLTEQKLVLITDYLPEASLGAVSLPQCANLDPEVVLGKFVCNTDKSVQEIKAKHVDQKCTAEESSVITASAQLSTENCETGKVTYYPLNVKFGYTIQDK